MSFLSKNLLFLLKKYGATQAQLASYVDASQNSISNWINEVSSPNVAILIKFHQFFGVSLDGLVLTDLEKSNIDFSENIEEFKKEGIAGKKDKGKTQPVAKNYFRGDDSNIVSEPDPVMNWAVMGQFKEVHTKLDTLLENTKPGGAKKPAKKS